MLKHKILTSFTTILFCLCVPTISAQNLLPYEWNIDFINNTSTATRGAKTHSSINLLLSWERQGYFAGDGDCKLSTSFYAGNPHSKYLLAIHLICDINNIQINGTTVASKLENKFWSDKNACSYIQIPENVLKSGTNNITVNCSSLGYTGGISYNFITLKPVNDMCKEQVYITLPTSNHVCLKNNRVATIHCKSNGKAILRLRIENEFHKQLLDRNYTLTQHDTIVRLNLNKLCNIPEFYQITAVMHATGYSGAVQWMAVKPEKIVCNNHPAPDFDKYWTDAKAELAAVKPNFKMHKVDSLCKKSTRDVYIVEMQSLGNLTIRGYYFVPRTAGKHIAVLQVPGYGWGYENIDNFLKERTNRVELALCVRGHGISADVFHPGFGTPGIWGYKLYNRDSIAYRAIYMDCVRAVDFLCSRPEVDNLRIGVKGGSQGGGLTLATAALCFGRIAACAYFDPFPCDMRHQILVRTTCKTELKDDLAYYGNPCSFDDMMNIQDLIDTRSFAPKIKCQVLYSAALFDDDCPVHGGFSAYNLITSPKRYIVFPNDGHIEGFSHDAQIMSWLDNELMK